jgi:hypothetical protein
MMETFNVYPKKDADKIQVELRSFEFKDGAFTLYSLIYSMNTLDVKQYVSIDNVAAVIPEPTPSYEDSHSFLVYLQGRKNPVQVYAAFFKCDTPPSVMFYWSERDRDDGKLIKNIYVALSEVVAILPFKKAV